MYTQKQLVAVLMLLRCSTAARERVCIYECVHIRMYMYICICTCVYTYTYTNLLAATSGCVLIRAVVLSDCGTGTCEHICMCAYMYAQYICI